LALDLVFIFGISVSWSRGSVQARLGMPFWPAAPWSGSHTAIGGA